MFSVLPPLSDLANPEDNTRDRVAASATSTAGTKSPKTPSGTCTSNASDALCSVVIVKVKI